MMNDTLEPAIDFSRSLTVTDLYQLNMADAYLQEGMKGSAVFEFFIRKMPPSRPYLIAAGLEQAVRYILTARVCKEELAWLRGTGRFSDRLMEFLETYSFSGNVDAPPEGTIVFADEPLIRVTAPIAEAQLMETRLINFLQYQTLVATKAARMVLAAPGKALVDFGLRRAHSGEAGVLAARASYIAGFAGTASVAAGRLFGVPLYGTMAHSYVQAHDSERSAFLGFARARPDQTVFLLDTFDTEAAALTTAAIAPQLSAEGISVRGVRLDSGDLADHAFKVRRILDAAGLADTRIVASGGLDEFALDRIVRSDAPIDVFGIGTSLVTSADQPALDCAYKLKAYGGTATRKRSEGKAYWPGATQVYRTYDHRGRIEQDLVTTAEDEAPPGAHALLKPVVRDGALVAPLPPMDAIRERAGEAMRSLPAHLAGLKAAPIHEARISSRLRALAQEVDARQMVGRQD